MILDFNYKDILSINNTNLDYYDPLHRFLIDIVTEYCCGPRLMGGQYICSIYTDENPYQDNEPWVYIECNPCINAAPSLVFRPGSEHLNFPLEILDSENPVQLARILGLERALAKATEKYANSAKELGKLWSEATKITELLDIAKKGN